MRRGAMGGEPLRSDPRVLPGPGGRAKTNPQIYTALRAVGTVSSPASMRRLMITWMFPTRTGVRGSNSRSNLSETERKSEVPNSVEPGGKQIREHPWTFGLGAGRSQVQILSPRLQKPC